MTNAELKASLQRELVELFADMTHEEINRHLNENYDVKLSDAVEECYQDDGVIEYFILNRNSFYLKAINAVLDTLNFTSVINEIREDEYSAATADLS